MIDYEKAYQEFEDEAFHHSLHPEISDEAKAVAMVALREKQERSAGCKYCKQTITSVKMNFETDSVLGESKWFSSTRAPKFCPMCGRHLMEAKKDG